MKKQVLILVTLLLPLVASAYDLADDKGLFYNLKGDGTLEVVGLDTETTTADILSDVTIGGMEYRVTSIGERAFEGRSDLTYLSIPWSVTLIGEYAFVDCGSSITVNIADPESWCAMELGNEHSSPLSSAGKVLVHDIETTSIIIPEGVTSIGNFTFYQCRCITSLAIPSSVKSIGSSAFEDCTGLTALTLNEGLESIGGSAFEGCIGLKMLRIPSTVNTISINAFANCTGITDVYCYAENVPTTDENAFDGTPTENSALHVPTNSVGAYSESWPWSDFRETLAVVRKIIHVATAGTLPNLISDDEKYQIDELTLTGELNGTDFFFIRKMAGIVFSVQNNHYNGGVHYSGTDGVLTSLDISNAIIIQGGDAYMATDDTFDNPHTITEIDWSYYYTNDNTISYLMFYGTKLESIVLPNSVISIANNAFRCPLTSITIPNSVTNIGNGAFSRCNSLTSIIVQNGNNKYDSRNNCNAIIESNSNKLIAGCKSTSIPNSVTSIGEGAFSGCSGMISVSIPNSVISIGSSAFQNCSGLTSIEIPNSMTSIGSSAFSGCSSLTTVSIPNSVTSIESSIFSGCKGMTSVIIPNSVTSIGDYAFSGCSGLTSITIPNSLTSIGNSAFSNCSGLTSVIIPNSVTSIGSSTLYGCSGLKSITIPNSVTTIGSYTFGNCSGLTSITIPNSVTAIGRCAFYGCSNLTSIMIPNSVTNIDENAFSYTGWYNNQPDGILYLENCLIDYKGDKPSGELVIRDGTRLLANNVFSWCSDLKSVIIPNSVTTIGSGTFKGCSGLTSVNIPNSVTVIGWEVFSLCSNLTSITIPNSVTAIGSDAFYYCSGITSIKIPNSVTSMGRNPFIGTGWYKKQPDGELYLNNCLLGFKGNNGPKGNYGIKEGTRLVADNAFGYASDLTSVNIPNSVTSIGLNTFLETGWYKNQPDGILYIDNCLIGYKGEKPSGALAIKDGTRLLANQAFYNCSDLISISIPNSMTSIGVGALYGTGWYNDQPYGILYLDNCLLGYKGEGPIGSLTIRNGTRLLANDALSWCSVLTLIKSYNSVPPSCETSSFHINVRDNSIIMVPKGCSAIYKNANGWRDFKNIKEIVVGDVCLDGLLNKDDLKTLVDCIMKREPEDFDKSLADLNGDENVNAADVVKLVDILNVQDGLSNDWQLSFNSNQVVSSLSCTLNNNGNKSIQLTKCELYYNQSLVGYATFNVTLASGGSKTSSFDGLNYATKTGFNVIWHYTYNGENYTCRFDLTE